MVRTTKRLASALALAAAMFIAAVSAQGPSALTGEVRAAGTGRPIAGAEVLLSPDGRGTDYRTTTDRAGAFRFDPVAPGPYRLTVRHPIYLDGAFGQRAADGPGTVIDLTSGRLTAASIELARGGAITGRLVDAFGDPVFGAEVGAWRRARDSRGDVLSRVRALTAPTNDLGQFRIARLAPGEYFMGVSVTPGAAAGGNAAVVWFPGTADVGRAHPVAVRPGEDIAVGDFLYTPLSSATVSGTVVYANGLPASNGIVRLVQHDGPTAIVNTRWFTRIRSGGTFAVVEVPPGAYTISAEAEVVSVADGWQFTAMPLVVNGDTSSVFMQLRPAARLRGRVEQVQALPVGNLSVVGLPLGQSFNNRRRAAVAGDGAFDLQLPPGRWSLTLEGLPELAAVDRIVAGGIDAAGTIRVGTTDIDGIRIAVEPFGAAIAGTVAHGARAAKPAVLLASDNPIVHPAAVAGVVVVTVSGGSFAIGNLRPGSYFIAAVDLADADALHEPVRRRQLLSKATSLTLTPGRTATLTLSLR